ncbi:methyltransferase domain-containing protein [Mesorhizobium marinum]|uniref:Methyltransferase domain-containing protein n=1 Tax=Mesorhizobium marinum TaxID=3228790 RepID=A0ABV3R0S1_9HYPH
MVRLDSKPSHPGLSVAGLARTPHPLVLEALSLRPPTGGRALDLGAGALNETRLLLGHGFFVDAVDSDPAVASDAAAIGDPRLRLFERDIRDFVIAPDAYDLIVAIHVLPFLSRAELRSVTAAAIAGLTSGGLLCCTLFGCQDEWAGTKPRLIFLERKEVAAGLAQLQQLVLRERKFMGADAKGRPKRWHVYQCICRKPDV